MHLSEDGRCFRIIFVEPITVFAFCCAKYMECALVDCFCRIGLLYSLMAESCYSCCMRGMITKQRKRAVKEEQIVGNWEKTGLGCVRHRYVMLSSRIANGRCRGPTVDLYRNVWIAAIA